MLDRSPPEILSSIFVFLDIKQLLELKLVCKRFNKHLSETQSLWKAACVLVWKDNDLNRSLKLEIDYMHSKASVIHEKISWAWIASYMQNILSVVRGERGWLCIGNIEQQLLLLWE